MLCLVAALLLAVAPLGGAQYTVWNVLSVYDTANCSGTVVAQYAEPIPVTMCNALSTACVIGDGNNTFFGLWQQRGCSSFTPAVTLAYRFMKSPTGDGLCGSFDTSYGVMSGCSPLDFTPDNGTTVTRTSIMPICYANRTVIQAYATRNCTGTQTTVFSLNIVPRFNTCTRSTDDNQTFWITTCPQVISAASSMVAGLACAFLIALAL